MAEFNSAYIYGNLNVTGKIVLNGEDINRKYATKIVFSNSTFHLENEKGEQIGNSVSL